MDKIHYSSSTPEWETPRELFNELDKEFNFTLDPCATKETAKCEQFFTKEENGLYQTWGKNTVFVNPPYGREIKHWIEKASREHERGATVVMLLPARTDTAYFHDYIYGKHSIRFIRGRVKFLLDSKEVNSAPFPSMIVVMNHSIII